MRMGEAFLQRALPLERAAVDRYGELGRHFTDRDMAAVAGLCHNLDAQHNQALQELSVASRGLELPVVEASPYHWIHRDSPEGEAREFFYATARPRALLEIALLSERDALQFYERFQQACAHDSLAARMALKAREHMRRLASAITALCPAVDWEPIIAAGGGPGLAMGAERRLRGCRQESTPIPQVP